MIGNKSVIYIAVNHCIKYDAITPLTGKSSGVYIVKTGGIDKKLPIKNVNIKATTKYYAILVYSSLIKL